MTILVTGSKGFIGKNLIFALKNNGYQDILEVDIDTDLQLLNKYCKDCDFVFHLAGVNRPKDISSFKNNFEFIEKILIFLEENNNKCPIMFASSIQAELDNPYGKSKKMAEDLIFGYCEKNSVKALVYRFPNVFGKWCRPNYNSAIATFCYNIANSLPITVSDPDVQMNLVYIDDLIKELINNLKGNENKKDEFCYVPVTYTATLGVIVDIITNFPNCCEDLSIPDQSDGFIKKLYATYLSYLPKEKFKYPLNMHIDSRGSFTEFIRTPDRGQVSVNIFKPNIIKGNHWHDSKNEKFLVASGKGIVRFRMTDSSEIFEIEVSGDNLEVVQIPPGYTHNIENIGETDMIVVIWVNEPFDPDNPDTYFVEV